MASPKTPESRTPSVRRSFQNDRAPSPAPSSVDSKSLFDGIALLPRKETGNFKDRSPTRWNIFKGELRRYLSSVGRMNSMLLVFLRSLRLVFLTAIGPWKNTREKPKVAIYQQWLPTILALGVHVMPLAAAITMLSINFTTTIVSDSISTTSLQYLAKALELLAQASISAAALAYFRRLYISPEGVPFGSITAGLQLNSLSYLWSLDFLGSLLSGNFHFRRKAAFVSFVLISSLLTATVGPAIATCLIPRIQDVVLYRNEAFFPVKEEAMYPARIDTDYVPDVCKYRNQSLAVNNICPFTGWDDLSQLLPGSGYALGGNNSRAYGVRDLHNNTTPFKFAIAATPILEMSPFKPEKSTVLDRIKNLRTLTWEHGGSPFLTAPSLRTLCRMVDVLSDSYKTDASPGETSGLSIHWQEPSPIARAFCQTQWHEDLSSSTTLKFVKLLSPGLHTIDLPNSATIQNKKDSWTVHWFESTISDFSIITLLVPPIGYAESTALNYVVCPILAGWTNSTQSVIFNQYPYTSNFSWSKDPVNISPGWATLLTPKFDISGAPAIDSLLSKASNRSWAGITWLWEHENSTIFLDEFSLILAGLVVNGMSTFNYTQPTEYVSVQYLRNNRMEYDMADSSTRYQTTYTIRADMLSYSSQGLAVQLSLAVLATYVAYILVFIIYTLSFNRTASFAWDSVSELTALALLSKPPEKSLENTRAGIETVELFKQQVHIRVVEGDKLELVFKDEDSGRPTSGVEPNHKY